MTKRRSGRELVDLVLDEGSFESWDGPVDRSGVEERYAAEIARAAKKSGSDEAVITGSGTIAGRKVALLVGEFGFLGGSIGGATADRIVAAIRQATAKGLPLLAATASGGTRMQEGAATFFEMSTIAKALVAHKAARLPYLVYLRHPTTGGVFASWGSLGHITAAEPKALIGFLGPKVYEELNGRPFPAGVQVAENLLDHGIVDLIFPHEEIADHMARALSLLQDGPGPSTLTVRPDKGAQPGLETWDSIERTRSASRPGVRELLRHGASDTIRLNGTNEGERCDAIILALTRVDGIPVVLIGQDRFAEAGGHELNPAGLRTARRGLRLAEEFGLPLISVVDTVGAELSKAAEEGAMAGEIGRCLAELSGLTVPNVSVILGQGCGGGALAMLPAHTVIAAEHGWLSPLPPEGASTIVYGDASHAAEMARSQGVAARELQAAGVVNTIVPEHPDAADEPVDFVRAVAAACGAALREQMPHE